MVRGVIAGHEATATGLQAAQSLRTRLNFNDRPHGIAAAARSDQPNDDGSFFGSFPRFLTAQEGKRSVQVRDPDVGSAISVPIESRHSAAEVVTLEERSE